MEFLGQTPSRLDDKNRMAIPAKFRAEFGDDPVYLMWQQDDGCIGMFTRESFVNTREEVKQHSRLTPEGRAQWRQRFGNVEPATPDSQGRFVVPGRLLELAGLKGPMDLVLVGMDEWLEIWPADKSRTGEG
jgi:MraZ protein